MQKKVATLVALIVSILSVGLIVNVANAGTANTVTGVDTRTAPMLGGVPGGESAGVFALGHRVYIYWGTVFPSGSTVDVIVYGPDGSVVAMWFNQPLSASGSTDLSFIVNQPGYYDISFNGQRFSISRTIAGVSLFVLPESALGSLMAIPIGLASIGLFAIARNRKRKGKASQ